VLLFGERIVARDQQRQEYRELAAFFVVGSSGEVGVEKQR
jgi:hypothetical protein